MQLFTIFTSLLLLLLPLAVQAQIVSLFTYIDYDREGYVMYAFRGSVVVTPASSVDAQMMVNLVFQAARDMQSQVDQLPSPQLQPAAMTAFTDGSGTVWFHSSIKGAAANTQALRAARVMTESVYQALRWCEEQGRGGHGNDGNCGEVGVVNMWMLETGMNRANRHTSWIVTVHVPQDGRNPYIIAPCGNPDIRGCQDFLRGVGLGNPSCQITRRGLPSVARGFPSVARDARVMRRQVTTKKAGADTTKKTGAAKQAVVAAPAGTAKKTAGAGAAAEKLPPKKGNKTFKPVKDVFKKAAALKKIPAAVKVAAKDLLNVWGLSACEKPGAKKATTKATTKATGSTGAAAGGAAAKTKPTTKCVLPKKLDAKGVCK
ncbi:hypothetical protein DFH27DRAFT_553300 [Peziza echinospora]|nr:hypothetical protein DFH27DRAFT_553300 [Peziza echinospora]